MTSYSLTLRKFITSQHVFTGVRITVCVLLPALLLYHNGLLRATMGLPLGALFIALADQPGPLHHRSNGMIAGIIINSIVVFIAGASAGIAWLIGLEIIVLSFIFSMSGVYGARAEAIGLIALIAFIISYGTQPFSQQPYYYTTFYFAAGGAWYALFSIVTNTVQPYRPTQQLLGELLMEMGFYLQHRSLFYERKANHADVVQKLIPHQIAIQQQQAALRDLLFKTRLFLKEPTNKGRRIMMIFLESSDLVERVMTSQQDYQQLHDDFADTDIMDQFRSTIQILADALVYTGLAVQNDDSFTSTKIDDAVDKCRQRFNELRTARLNAGNIAAFIRLRYVLNSVQDVADRIKRTQEFTSTKTRVGRVVKHEEIAPFTTHQNFNISLLLSNISLKSTLFRHALRITIAMAAGYAISILFSLGHSYWMLLTIATILKPAFSTSQKRNIERVAGTLAGAGVAFLTLHFAEKDNPIFIMMIVAMLVAYSSLRVNNLISTAGITLYVVLSFHFLYPSGVDNVLIDRVIDTIIGAVIAFTASYFLFPVWEHRQIRPVFAEAIKSNKEYFKAVIEIYTNRNADTILSYKLARRSAFVALANLSDALQRMLSEPKSRQKNLQEYHQLVTTNHMLTSYIASLAYYADQLEDEHDARQFKPMMQYTCRQLESLEQVMQKPGVMLKKADPFPVNNKIKELIDQRKQELMASEDINASAVMKQVSLLKSIADQFQLINSTVEDMMKILGLMDSADLHQSAQGVT